MYRYIYEKDAVSLLNTIDQLIERGISIKRLTVDLIEILKKGTISEYIEDASLLHVLNSKKILTLTDGKSIAGKFRMMHLLIETYDKYGSATNTESYFEVCLLQVLDVEAAVATTTISHPLETPGQEQKPVSTVNSVSRKISRKKPILEVPMGDEPFTSYNTPVFDSPVTKSTKSSHIPGNVVSKGATAVSTKALKPLDNEFVLGLLTGANEPEEAKGSQHFQRIPEFMLNFRYAKYGSLLRNAGIVGSGNTYIVICIDNRTVANEINEMDSKNEFHDFITVLMEKDREILAISTGQQKYVIEKFKDRMIAGTLPDPIQIEVVAIEKKEVGELTQEEAVLDLFSQENIVIAEE